MKGYGFSEQLGAPLAEVTNNKLRGIKEQVEMLAAQKEDNDYLTQKFADWKTGLVFMIKQLEAGWKAIEAELGDVIKNDIIAPLRDWWVEISTSILNSGMKEQFHRAILGFVHGLGFDDVAALLKGLTSHVHGFDLVGFATGVGEGLRNLATGIKTLFDALTFGSGDAEMIGKIAAELFGLSIAAMVMGPVIGIVTAFTSGISALASAFMLARDLSGLTGLTAGLKALVALEFVPTAAGLLKFAGALGIIAAAVQALISSGILNAFHMPKDMSADEWKKFAWGVDKDGKAIEPKVFGQSLTGGATAFPGKPYNDLGLPGIENESFTGGDIRSLLHKTSWNSDGSDDEIKDAILSTARSTDAMQESLRRSAALAMLATIEAGMDAHGGDSDSVGGGGGGGGGASSSGGRNMRYGRGSSGSYRGTPGAGGPNMSGGAGGSRSWRNNNPGNIEYGAYAKSMGATGTDGRFAVFPDYQSGRHAQEHLLFDSKGYKDLTLGQAINKWAPGSENNVPAYIAAMGGDANAKMSSFNPQQRSALLDAMQKHEGWKVGTRQNTAGPGGGASVPMSGDAAQRIAKMKSAGLLTDEQCVTLAMASVGIHKGSGLGGNVHDWRAGANVADGDLKAGTPISTFLNRNGSQSSLYAGGGSGTPGAHLDHAGMFEKYINDATGKRIGFMMAEQYKNSGGVHDKAYYFGKGSGEGDGSNYRAVMAGGGLLGGANNPSARAAALASIGATAEHLHRQALTQDRKKLPDPAYSGGAGMVQASNVTVNNHIHDATDPQRVADAVGKHLDRQMSSRAIDVSHAA